MEYTAIKRGAYDLTGTKIPGAPEELVSGLDVKIQKTLDIEDVETLITDLTSWVAIEKRSNLSAKLPQYSAAYHPMTKRGIVIEAGKDGYFDSVDVDVERYNKLRAVTKAQQAAMLTGSLFGWGVPGADPDNYTDDGKFNADAVTG